MIDVLVGTFLGDTGAYLGGRLFGRRPLAPAISPNKTVEGLLIGMVCAIVGVWFAGRYQDWLPGDRRARARPRRRARRAGRRPVRVASSSARPASRTPAACSAPTAARSTASTRSCSRPSPATTSGPPMSTESALRSHEPDSGRAPSASLILGSTGSIGDAGARRRARAERAARARRALRRALLGALVEQARDARRASGSRSPTSDAAARAAEAWTDGEVLGGAEGLVRLVVESGADLVLNALVGSAGLGPTVATLGEGDRPGARQQGVAGRRRRARERARRSDRRADRAGRLRAHRAAPAARRAAARARSSA